MREIPEDLLPRVVAARLCGVRVHVRLSKFAGCDPYAQYFACVEYFSGHCGNGAFGPTPEAALMKALDQFESSHVSSGAA